MPNNTVNTDAAVDTDKKRGLSEDIRGQLNQTLSVLRETCEDLDLRHCRDAHAKYVEKLSGFEMATRIVYRILDSRSI